MLMRKFGGIALPKFLTVTTASRLSVWRASGIVNLGDELIWNASQGTPPSAVGNTPSFNLVGTTGNTTVTVENSENISQIQFIGGGLINSIDVTQCPNLTYLNTRQNLNLPVIDTSQNPLLNSYWVYQNQMTAVGFDISNNMLLSDIRNYINPLIGYRPYHLYTELTVLQCHTTNLGSINTAPLTKLTNLWVASNGLTSLSVSTLINLTYLSCESNPLTALDVTNNLLLTTLIFNNTDITSINLINNTELLTFNCYATKLTTLDLSTNTKLKTLNIGSISTYTGILDLSNNLDLISLTTINTLLTTLDLSLHTKLTYIEISNCGLSVINVLANLNLGDLRCVTNSFTSLILANLTKIFRLFCNNNIMTYLDLTNTPALTTLRCEVNNLTTLDLSWNPLLSYLHCYSNNIVGLRLNTNPKINVCLVFANNMSASDTDQIYIDLASGNVRSGNLQIRNNRTSASDTARATLVGWGWTFNETYTT